MVSEAQESLDTHVAAVLTLCLRLRPLDVSRTEEVLRTLASIEGWVPSHSNPDPQAAGSAVARQQGDGHSEAALREMLGPGKDTERAAGEAVADRHPGACIGAMAGVAERCGRQGSAASGHVPIVSLFGTKLTRVGCH